MGVRACVRVSARVCERADVRTPHSHEEGHFRDVSSQNNVYLGNTTLFVDVTRMLPAI